MIKKLLFIKLLLLFIVSAIHARAAEYLAAKPEKGDGIYTFLSRYYLPTTEDQLKIFIIMNEGKFDKNDRLFQHESYLLPIRIVKFNGKTIRSTLDIDDDDLAKEIEDYNKKVVKAGVKKDYFRKDRILWVPLYFGIFEPDTIAPVTIPQAKSEATVNYAIFGKEYEKIILKDNLLKGHIFYLDAGHGGPDPGAVGYKSSHQMCEDEYAYDVILRTGLNLLQHGATVYFIVQDPNDGIRKDKYLLCDDDEYYYGDDTIDIDQKERLGKRAEIINNLYNENIKIAKSQQVVIMHVDSRITNQRIDIFFYYNSGSSGGEKLANALCNKIKNKYIINQPGRGYKGTVSSRSLFMLRETLPTAVYIELGNIQNERDQIRLIEENNRQAIANWIAEGLIEYSK